MTKEARKPLDIAVQHTADFLQKRLSAVERRAREHVDKVEASAACLATDLEERVARLSAQLDALVETSGARIEELGRQVGDLESELKRAQDLAASYAGKLKKAEAGAVRVAQDRDRLASALAVANARAETAERLVITPTALQRALIEAIAREARVFVYRVEDLDGAACELLAVSPVYLGANFRGRDVLRRACPYLFSGRRLQEDALREVLAGLGVVADPDFAEGTVERASRKMLLLRRERLDAVLHRLDLELKGLRGGVSLHTNPRPGGYFADGDPGDTIPF